MTEAAPRTIFEGNVVTVSVNDLQYEATTVFNVITNVD